MGFVKKHRRKIVITTLSLVLVAMAGLAWVYAQSNLTIKPAEVTEPLVPLRIGPYLFKVPQSISKIGRNEPYSALHFPHDSMGFQEFKYINLNDKDAEFEAAVTALVGQADVFGSDDVSSEFADTAFVVYFKRINDGKESISCTTILKGPEGYLQFNRLGVHKPSDTGETVYVSREEIKKQAISLIKLFLQDYRWTGDQPCLNGAGYKTKHGMVVNQNNTYLMSSGAILRDETLKKALHIDINIFWRNTEPPPALPETLGFFYYKLLRSLFALRSYGEPAIEKVNMAVAGLPGVGVIIVDPAVGNPNTPTSLDVAWWSPVKSINDMLVRPLNFSLFANSYRGTVVSDLPQILGEWDVFTENIQFVGE